MKKTIILVILFILTLILAIVIINTEYKFEDTRQMSTTFSQISHNQISDYMGGNVSFAPIEEYCSENSMSIWIGSKITDTGCIDSSGKIYSYNISYKEGIWKIGNKEYVAVWK
jgi:hypothetical protein